MSFSLDQVFELAARRAGSRKAVLSAIRVSRQRFYSATHGGPPLHIERLLRLAMVAGTDPLDTLRAGGRAPFADLLEEVARPRLGVTTILQRALLDEYVQLSDHTQWVIRWVVSELAAERRGDGEGLVRPDFPHP